MKRRDFIGIAAIGSFGIAVGSGIFFSDFEKLVRKIIINDTLPLGINSAEVDKFLIAARNGNIWSMFSGAKKELIKWSFYLENKIFTLPYHTKYKIYRSQIVGLFLLSTNYFQDKMQSSNIYFTHIYNPYFTPCSNPFSNLYYS